MEWSLLFSNLSEIGKFANGMTSFGALFLLGFGSVWYLNSEIKNNRKQMEEERNNHAKEISFLKNQLDLKDYIISKLIGIIDRHTIIIDNIVETNPTTPILTRTNQKILQEIKQDVKNIKTALEKETLELNIKKDDVEERNQPTP